MSAFRHAVAYVTLGLLCGWYFFLLFLYPVLIYWAYHGSVVAGTVLAIFVALTVAPLRHEPEEWFMYSWIFGVWREYFGYTFDCESVHHGKLDVKKRYMFLEFPHGVFPMGQFLSASLVDDISPGQMICGTGADIIFKVRCLVVWGGHALGTPTSFLTHPVWLTRDVTGAGDASSDGVARHDAGQPQKHHQDLREGVPLRSDPRRHR
jgi:2-acylglycerol O-acyltransferase 2